MRNRFAILIASIIALSAVAVVAQGQGNRVAVSIPASSEILASCAGGIVYVTPEGAARVVGCSNPATATATVPPTASMTPGPTNTAGPSSTPTITPTPDAQWWLAGGVDPADVVGAWRAKGAASWPASLVNLGGGQPLHAPQSQPTWTAAKGWQGGQGRQLQVTGGVSVTYGWSYVLKVRNAAIGSQQFMGCRRIWNDQYTGMDLNNTGGYQSISSFYSGTGNPLVLTGTMTLAGSAYYVDGVRRANTVLPSPTPGGQGCGAADLMIMSLSWGGAPYHGAPHGGNLQTEVQGVAVYSDTLTAGQAAAIATAVGGW